MNFCFNSNDLSLDNISRAIVTPTVNRTIESESESASERLTPSPFSKQFMYHSQSDSERASRPDGCLVLALLLLAQLEVFWSGSRAVNYTQKHLVWCVRVLWTVHIRDTQTQIHEQYTEICLFQFWFWICKTKVLSVRSILMVWITRLEKFTKKSKNLNFWI